MSHPPGKPPSKDQLRAELRKAVADYVDKGGEIEKVPSGVSGRDEHTPYHRPLFEAPKPSRTAVDEAIASIESRRRKKPEHRPRNRPRKGPREKIVYDDFGEPVRKVWVEE